MIWVRDGSNEIVENERPKNVPSPGVICTNNHNAVIPNGSITTKEYKGGKNVLFDFNTENI
jgi:hypothetical protein